MRRQHEVVLPEQSVYKLRFPDRARRGFARLFYLQLYTGRTARRAARYSLPFRAGRWPRDQIYAGREQARVQRETAMQLQKLSAGRGALTAVRTGEGRDLVLLHSLLADRFAFDSVLPKLAAKHRVTLFNLPGFRGSQPAMLALMDAYLAVIEDGFDEFGIAKDSVLIGNGFGGTVALAFALAHPERISKLVVSDAAAGFLPEGREAFAVMAEKVADGGLGSIAEIAAKRVFSPAYLAAHPEKIEERKKVLLAIDPKAFH